MPVGPRLPPSHSLHWLGLSFVVLFGFMLCVGLYYGGKNVYLLREGQRVEGTVVIMRRGSKGSTTPIVEFTTKSGKRVRFEGDSSSHPPAHKVGDKVIVHYDPGRPSYAVIDTFREMWVLPVLFGSLGSVGILIGAAVTVASVRRKRARDRVKAGGLRVLATVVGANPIPVKGGANYEPVVELSDPHTGAPVRCVGDQQRHPPPVGARAVVHIGTAPPHGYFVEMG